MAHLNDVFISSNTYIKDMNLEVGAHVAIDSGLYSTVKMKIGDYVHISANVSIIGGLTSTIVLEDFSFLSTGTRVICSSDGINGLIGPTIPREYREVEDTIVYFKKYSGTFSNCVIAPGSIIKEGAIIAANSYFKGIAEPWVIYAGSPAKPISKRNKYKVLKLAEDLDERNKRY